MKKSDIKNGMHVITNDGTEYIIISGIEAYEQKVNTANIIMVQLDGGWMALDDYDDDLHYHDPEGDEYNEDKLYDIKTVYAPRYYSWALSSIYKNPTDFAKVWERPITKKMTKAEIEKELGYEIEIID
jgi:hypothetical protein